MSGTPILTAALAGVPIGIQRQGVYAGRRQLFVRFAGPAETATMYTADALARELNRALERSSLHSICIAGRDALGNAEYLAAALRQITRKVQIVVDTDGQRPDALAVLQPFISMVQVTLELPVAGPSTERAVETLRWAGRIGCQHAVVIAGSDEASDAEYLQIVELAHGASPSVRVVVHPGPGAERGSVDRRWGVLMEHAMAKHEDVVISFRMTGPATVR